MAKIVYSDIVVANINAKMCNILDAIEDIKNGTLSQEHGLRIIRSIAREVKEVTPSYAPDGTVIVDMSKK